MTYWRYTYIKPAGKGFIMGFGISSSLGDEFDFASFYRQHPEWSIVNLTAIGRTQYELLNKLIEEQNDKRTV